ncbi:hypothetical protein AWENTII_007569 [Aspergillus wentii]
MMRRMEDGQDFSQSCHHRSPRERLQRETKTTTTTTTRSSHEEDWQRPNQVQRTVHSMLHQEIMLPFPPHPTRVGPASTATAGRQFLSCCRATIVIFVFIRG